jgi:hypothetical protein
VNDTIAHGVFLLHLAATMFMVGVIWFVQIVHYPLLARVGSAEAVAYEQAHTQRTGWVVSPSMLLEGASAVLLFWVRPAGVSDLQAGIGVALSVVVWISTFLVQVPCHERLCREFDRGVHRRLVRSNWVRTAAWSLRGLVVLWMVHNTIR